jgi:hypothetical protein
MLRRLFVTDSQSPPVAEPSHRAFNDVSDFAQAAAMGGAAWVQQTLNLHGNNSGDDPGKAVTAIADQSLGLGTRTPSWSLNRGKIPNHLHHRNVVADIGGRGVNQERQPLGLGDDMSFAPVFSAVYGARSGMSPPKMARTDSESTTARRRSISPRRPRRLSRS